MKKLRLQIIIILVTGLVVGLLLLSQQPANPNITSVPQSGGVYSEAIVGSFQRLNPLLDHYNQADRDVDRLIFSSLMKHNYEGYPEPDLVESWGYSKDGLTYNFALRQNVIWHDGEPFTAADVLFTIELMRGDDSVVPSDIKSLWKDIQVKSFNDFNIQFVLPEPFAPFMDYLRFGILPKHILEGQSFDQITSSTFNLEPIGTGPYKLDQLDVADSGVSGLSLKLNEDYYGKKPYLERILIQYYPTSRQAYTAYLEGKVQGISFLSSDVLPDALKDENLSIYSSRKPEMSLVFINLKNTQVEFLQDLSIRKALMYSINRSYIINQLLGGQAIAANSPIFPGSWAYYDSEPYVYDIEEATNILKNAGYTFVKDGDLVRSKEDVYLTFTLLHPDDEYHSRIAEALAKDWKRIGVEAILSPIPYDQLIDGNLVQRDYQAALVDMNLSSYPDPDPYPFWDQAQATGGQNYSQWDNRAASEYLEQARISVDPIERKRQYANFQVIFRKEIPSLLLYYPVYSYAIDVQVQGVQIGPLYDASDRFMTINDWFLTVRRSSPLDLTQPSATP